MFAGLILKTQTVLKARLGFSIVRSVQTKLINKCHVNLCQQKDEFTSDIGPGYKGATHIQNELRYSCL